MTDIKYDWNIWADKSAEERIEVWDSLLEKARKLDFESMTLEQKALMVERINAEDCFCDHCEERYPFEMSFVFGEEGDDELIEKIGAERYETWCVWCIADECKPKCINCGTTSPNKEECRRYYDGDWIHFEGHDFPPGDDAQ